MAKLMVLIDIPNYDYNELREMRVHGVESTIVGLVFGKIKGNVLVHKRYLDNNHEGDFYRFKLIGIRS